MDDCSKSVAIMGDDRSDLGCGDYRDCLDLGCGNYGDCLDQGCGDYGDDRSNLDCGNYGDDHKDTHDYHTCTHSNTHTTHIHMYTLHMYTLHTYTHGQHIRTY